MWEIIRSILLSLLFALVCIIGAGALKTYKQQILKTIADLVQSAENAVAGSGMGTEKKAKVIAQLEAMGITVTKKISKLIDDTVTYLNDKGAWLTSDATDKLKDAVGAVIADE